jgi:hypothetical protein
MMKVMMVVVMVVQIMMMILSLLVQAPKMGEAVPWSYYWGVLASTYNYTK